jgi:ribonuclease H / adenosylcobalamin/alpha-ribazole phosphatase
MIFLYADGASRGNPGPAAYGVHIIDANGAVIAEIGEALGVATNNQAEYAAVIAGLRFLTQTPHRAVTIRMDSKLVVEQLSGRWKINNPQLRELADQAKALLLEFDAILEWIPREENSKADANANSALDKGNFSTAADSQLELASVQPRSIRAPRQYLEPTTIIVVRHGHTINTEKNLVSGGDGTDPALSELGSAEAKSAASEIPRLVKLFSLPDPAIVFHSPMLRTTETAQEIAKSLNLDLQADARLKEIGFGEWEMMDMAQLETDSLDLVSAWRGSVVSAPPAGESVMQMKDRVWESLGEIIESYLGSCAVISTHMMPTRAIAAAALRGSDSIFWNLNTSPGGISVYRFFGIEYAEIFTLNYCAHLQQK